MIEALLSFAVGLACGGAGYRALLKRNPERLEALARAVKAAGRRV